MPKYDPETRVVNEFVKDAGKLSLGLKDARITLKMSDGELTLLKNVCEHMHVREAQWAEIAAMRFLEGLDGPEPGAGERTADAKRWVRPVNATHMKNFRQTARTMQRLTVVGSRLLGLDDRPFKPGTLLRFAFIYEGLAELKRPSWEQKATESQKARKALEQKAAEQPRFFKVTQATGYYTGVPAIITNEEK